MKKFKFQLEAVRKVAQLKKDRAEIAFAEAVDVLQKAKALLKQHERDLQSAYDDFDHMQEKTSVNIAMLVMYSNYFEHLKRLIEKQENAVEAARKDKDGKLKILQYEMRRLESIEKLKEKRRQEYFAAQIAEEQKNLDEIGLQIYVRTAR